MADEFTMTLRAEWDIGTVTGSLPNAFCEALGIDVAGDQLIHNCQTVGTTEEALLLGDITAGGGMFIGINRSAANFISIRPGTGEHDVVKLLPGEPCIFRMQPTAPYVIADTASCVLEYWLFEV